MSSMLDKSLRTEHNVRSLPIRKDDEVEIMRGRHKGKSGKVISVYRRKWVIHVERVTMNKKDGRTVQIGIHPSNVKITKIKMDKDRLATIKRKADGREFVEARKNL